MISLSGFAMVQQKWCVKEYSWIFLCPFLWANAPYQYALTKGESDGHVLAGESS